MLSYPKTMSPKLFNDIVDCRLLLLILLPLSLFLYLSLSSSATHPFSLIPAGGIRDLRWHPAPPQDNRSPDLNRSRIAICLVGGARRFELTGPSLIDNLLKRYSNSDLFLHSPLDGDSYKFAVLRGAPRIAAVRIFAPRPLAETEEQARVLTSHGSPNGIQGLLQYFSMVEGCLNLINTYQTQKNFTYDWIIRTRVDGYWSAPLEPDHFVQSKYVVPSGSQYNGLNDRFGIGDSATSLAALSRLALIPLLDAAGYCQLNSESAFKAQLSVSGVAYQLNRFPFCIVTDRQYEFPPSRFGVPVASMSSLGPLSGAKCRPCKPVCVGPCVADVVGSLYHGWSWTDWENGSLALCDASGPWETGWEEIFDRGAGRKRAMVRKRMSKLSLHQCIEDFERVKNQTAIWDAPEPAHICRVGLGSKAGDRG